MNDATMVSKFHCETCKLSYASQSELQEHLWSLMHHVRLEQKEKTPEHVCCLCQTSTSNLVQYGQHLNELRHKKALTKLREKKISESTKPAPLLSLKTTIPPFLMPNESWHLNYPFSHLKPYISPLNGRKHLPQPYQSYPKVNPMRDNIPSSEERIGFNYNENDTNIGGEDKTIGDQESFKGNTVKQNEVSVGKKKVLIKKKKKKKDNLDIQSSPSTNDQSLSANWLPESSVLAPRAKKKMIVTTPSGFRQGLFIQEDFKKNNLDIVRLNLINATNDKGDKVFANKLIAGFVKDNNNSSQHSSLPYIQTQIFTSRKLTTKNKSLKTSSISKKRLKSLALSPLKVPSKTQTESDLKIIPSKVTKPLEAVKDNHNDKSTAQMEIEPNVQSENLLHSPSIPSDTVETSQNSKSSPNIPSNTVETSENSKNSPNLPCVTVETTKNSKNSEICNSLSQSSENNWLTIKSPDSKESNSNATKLLEGKSNSSVSIDFSTCKPTGSLSETAISGVVRKRALSSEYFASSGKLNLLKKLKSSTSKEMSISDKNQNLNVDAANNSGKKVDPASNFSAVSSLHERSNHSEEITSTKPDSTTVEKQQLSKNVGKEELVKMTKLSCLNHKEKMHLSSVMKSYTKTQNKRSAVPRLTMQLSGIYNSTNQGENNKKLNLPEGLEEQITMLIKKENLDEFGSTETFSNSDQLITETSQSNMQMDLVPTTVSDPLQPLFPLDQSNFTSVSKKPSVSAINKTSTKSSAVKSKTNKSLSKITQHTPPSSCATICTPTTTTNTAISTTTTTTTTTAAASNSSKIVDQNIVVEDTGGSNSQAPDVFNQVYLLTLQEEEVCSNISNLNNRISYMEKLIEDSKIALQACKDEQLSLMEEEKKIRKMRIGILKEAMGDTNRSNSELINHILRSHLASEERHQNTSIPPVSSIEKPFCTQQDNTIDQTQQMQLRPDGTTAIPTITQQKQPTLAALLAKRNQTESLLKLQMNCSTQETQPQQSDSFTQQKALQLSSVTQEKPHQSSSVSQKKSLTNLLKKGVTKSLKIPKAFIDSASKNQKPSSGMLDLQQSSPGIFSQQVETNTLQTPNNTSGAKESMNNVFQFNQETSTKETNNISKSSKLQQHSNNNVEIKMEPISPEALETNPSVSGSVFNFVSIKEEPKSPTEFGGFGLDEFRQDSSSTISHSDNQQKMNSIKQNQPELFLESSVGEVNSNIDNPLSSESRLVNSINNNIRNEKLSPEQNLQTSRSESSSNLPIDESGQICVKEALLSPAPEAATTTRVRQSAMSSLQSTATSNNSMKPNSLPANSNDKEKSNEELEFFSSLSMKNLLDSSRIERLPENVDPEKCSGNVSMKYLGSMSNNLVEQLKECWKKQNVTMNKCFPQGQSDDTVPVANTSYLPPFTSTSETSIKLENCSTPTHDVTPPSTPPYIVNVDKSNNFILPASLNPVVSIKPLSLSSKHNSLRSKYLECVDVNTAKSSSKLSKTTCNSYRSSDESQTDDASTSLIVIDGDSSSEDNGTDNTVNKFLPSTTILNTIPEGFSAHTLQNQFSAESQRKVSDLTSTSIKLYKGPNCPVTGCVIFGNYLYASYQGHSPQKFDLKTAICVKQYDCQAFSVQCMLVTGFSVENPRVFSGGASEVLLVFNEISGELVTKLDLMKKIYTFHEKWNSVFVGLAHGGVSKISLKTLKETSNISYGTKPIHCLATCTEGALRILCVGAYDASILIVDASSGLLLKTLLPCQRLLYSIKVSQNLIYSCSEDRKLAVYDIESGNLLKCIQGHSGTVSCLYVDNKILVTGSYDKLINVYWEAHTDLDKTLPLSFYGAGKQSISCLTVSNRKIYSGNFYGLVEALDLPNGSSPQKWPCRYNKCRLIFGLYENLKHHLHSEHLKGQIAKWNNWQCQWIFCSETFNSLSLLMTHCDKHLKQ